jgi:hypothetical protein
VNDVNFHFFFIFLSFINTDTSFVCPYSYFDLLVQSLKILG